MWGYGSMRDPHRTFLFLWRLDDVGEIADEWSAPEGDFRDPPALVVRGERVFLLNATGGFEGSQVLLREFGCVP